MDSMYISVINVFRGFRPQQIVFSRNPSPSTNNPSNKSNLQTNPLEDIYDREGNTSYFFNYFQNTIHNPVIFTI